MDNPVGVRISVAHALGPPSSPQDEAREAAVRIHARTVDAIVESNAHRAQRAETPLERLLSQPSPLDRFVDPDVKPPQPR